MVNSYFVLGPSLDSVTEIAPLAPHTPGRRQIGFGSPATEPGGKVNVSILPAGLPDDVLPVNLYAFYVPQRVSIPFPQDRTPEFFFGEPTALNGSAPVSSADPATGALQIVVPGVTPGVYFLQTVLEFSSPPPAG